MGLPKLKTKISVEDYLEGEKVSPIRYEYVNGEVYAMAGSSDNHNRIARNTVTILSNYLRNSRCEPFFNDIKVRVTPTVYYYPDIFVACDNPNPYYRNEPILIVEVLSPKTERTDRNEKLNVYRRITSLQEYLIVAQDKMLCELHYRDKNQNWNAQVFTESEELIEFASINLSLSLNDIYRNVEF
ncbi:MAG: Uma2 family endonuclease [Pyrinomonadaceae bacterium]|nr:Uma2 family endonuclease [Pyrinomonadaceae bacterium]